MSMFTRTLSMLIILLVSLSSSRAWPTTAQSQPTSAQATTVLIGLRPGVPALPDGRPPLGPAHSLAISSVEALPVAPGGTPLYRLRLAPGTEVAAALTALRAAPALAFAELDQQAVALTVPTDPGYSQQ